MKEPELKCMICVSMRNKKDDDLAEACSYCKGDHPHINAKMLDTDNNSFMVKCPYCKNVHFHNDIGTHTCREYIYTIKPINVKGLVFSEYSTILCPLCSGIHNYDSLPKGIFQPECKGGILKIKWIEENFFHSTQRIATNRLNAI